MDELLNLSALLFRASAQAVVLVALVLLVQWLFRRTLTPRWRCALWWLVLVRLALPVSLESTVSIFNLAKFVPASAVADRSDTEAPEHPSSIQPLPASSPEANPPRVAPQTLESLSLAPTGTDPAPVPDWFEVLCSWPGALALLWLTGAALLAMRVYWENRCWRDRLLTQTTLADASLQVLLEECQGRMRMLTPIILEETTAVNSPVLYGWLRPRLLMPKGLAGRLSPEELRFIFLHELAHVRRRDIALNWLLAALQIVHWFNPGVWFSFARLRADRELACDALALECAGEEQRQPYGETILKLLTDGPPPARLPGLAGIIEDRSAMQRRIRMIAAFKRPSRWSWLAGILVAALAWVTLTDALSPTPDSTASSPSDIRTPRPMRIPDPSEAGNIASPRWLDTMEVLAIHRETREPVAGVTIEVVMDDRTTTNTTDAAGLVHIALPQQRPRGMSLMTLKDGFLQSYTHWYLAERNANLPPRYTVPLDPGAVVGGVVRDHSGKPLAGVEIKGDYSGPFDEESPGILGFPQANIIKFFRWSEPVLTDAKGRWQTRIKLEEVSSLYLVMRHPQHVPKQVEVRGAAKILEPLRAEKLETVLEAGWPVTGRVLDRAGRPVTNAVVRHGLVQVYDTVTTTTDANGGFAFDQHFPAGPFELIVQSPDHAPEKRQLVLKRGLAPVEFRLAPGHTLRVRLVDDAGRPVAKATMRLASWQTSPKEPPGGPSDLELVAETDAEGRFEWRGAPPDPVMFDISHLDFHAQEKVPLRPGPEELTVKLHAALVLSGRVTDAVTGQPVPRFTVVQGDASDQMVNGKLGIRPFWNPYQRPLFHNGTYEMRITSPVVGGQDHFPNQVLRIEAEGYTPAISRYFKPDAGRQIWDVKLTPADNLTGTIRGPNGQPLPGVTIYVQNGSCVPHMQDGRLGAGQSWDGLTLFSDHEGKYSLPAEPADCLVYFVHAQGWLETSLHRLTNAPSFTLPAWGRVEGVWRANGKPSQNEPVELVTDLQENGPTFSFQAKTDSQGRFHFDQVPPGTTWLGVRVNLSANSWTTRRVGNSFQVKAGETAHVTNGDPAKGRTVIGRFVAGAGVPAKLAMTDSICELERDNPDLRPAPAPPGLSRRERNAWTKEWFDSEAGQAYQKQFEKEHLTFAVKIAANGTFRAEGVPPGNYNLNASFWRRLTKKTTAADADADDDQDILADAMKEFVVPPLTDGLFASKSLDLGNLTVIPNQGILVGKPAPALVLPTISGTNFNLAEQRGKYVVLHFWNGTGGNWVDGQFRALKTMHASLATPQRLVMLSVNLDTHGDEESPIEARKYLDETKPAWPQALAGGWPLGIRRSPLCYLIGPDGTVLAKKATPDKLQPEVTRVLGPK